MTSPNNEKITILPPPLATPQTAQEFQTTISTWRKKRASHECMATEQKRDMLNAPVCVNKKKKEKETTSSGSF